MRTSCLSPLVLGFAVVLTVPTAATRQSTPPPEDFTALAVTMGNVGPSQPTTVDINIRRWSTDDERNGLVTVLVEKGADALLEALRTNEPVGRIRTPDSVGYDLRYAHQSRLEGGGRRVASPRIGRLDSGRPPTGRARSTTRSP